MAANKLLLNTFVSDHVTVETVSFEGGFVTYYRVNGKRIGTLAYYDDEMDAREGHLYWIKQDWNHKMPAEIEELVRL
jgi:hypothetical protein